MRRMLTALSAGLAVASGAAVLASAAQAQPYGYYRDNGYYGYRYDPPRAYGADGRYAPYSYYNGYNGAGVAGALIGSMMGYGANVPYDRYGADPNGMIGPDGHRIKCKLRSRYDGYYGGYRTVRECY